MCTSQEDSVSPDVEPVAERSVTGTPAIQVGGLADSPLAMRRRISVGQPIHPPTGELLSLQKPLLPAISNIKDGNTDVLILLSSYMLWFISQQTIWSF